MKRRIKRDEVERRTQPGIRKLLFVSTARSKSQKRVPVQQIPTKKLLESGGGRGTVSWGREDLSQGEGG